MTLETAGEPPESQILLGTRPTPETHPPATLPSEPDISKAQGRKAVVKFIGSALGVWMQSAAPKEEQGFRQAGLRTLGSRRTIAAPQDLPVQAEPDTHALSVLLR